MIIERYLRIITLVGYVGKPLKDMETQLSQEWGVSIRAVYYMINKLRKEDLLRFRRYGKTNKIFVVPTAKLRKLMAEVQEGWLIK